MLWTAWTRDTTTHGTRDPIDWRHPMLLTRAFSLSFTQSQVDFVIPDLAVDLRLSIDPFLLFKSRDDELKQLHNHLLSIFEEGIRLFRSGDRIGLDHLIDFPEVNEIGFGYSEGRIQGLGLGVELNRLLANTLSASPELQERGLRHVEELQLVTIGVGPDRVSDIAANVLKRFLIDYTQRQAELWSIPLTKDVPVAHYFDFEDWVWSDGYFDLPRNPISGLPILLVPRRIVRLLPWINYDDYARTDFTMFLQPNRAARRNPGKNDVIEVSRRQLDLVDRYVDRKEREALHAEPALVGGSITSQSIIDLGNQFIEQLRNLPPGQAASGDYQRLVYEIFNYLFEPELTDGEMEVETFLGTERRDIIYINESERSFLKYVRETYQSLFLLLEIKNVKEVELDHINQVAVYLGARLGMLGFIVARHPPGENIIRKTYSVFSDTPSTPRKVILIITDDDLIAMIRLKQAGREPVKQLRDIYRGFRQRVQ